MSSATSGRCCHHRLDGCRRAVDPQLGSGHRDAVVAEHSKVDNAAMRVGEGLAANEVTTASSSMSERSRRQIGAHEVGHHLLGDSHYASRRYGRLGRREASNTWMRALDLPAEVGRRRPGCDDPTVLEGGQDSCRSRPRWWRHRVAVEPHRVVLPGRRHPRVEAGDAAIDRHDGGGAPFGKTRSKAAARARDYRSAESGGRDKRPVGPGAVGQHAGDGGDRQRSVQMGEAAATRGSANPPAPSAPRRADAPGQRQARAGPGGRRTGAGPGGRPGRGRQVENPAETKEASTTCRRRALPATAPSRRGAGAARTRRHRSGGSARAPVGSRTPPDRHAR